MRAEEHAGVSVPVLADVEPTTQKSGVFFCSSPHSCLEPHFLTELKAHLYVITLGRASQ